MGRQPSNNRGIKVKYMRRGFTLIELLVVIAIISIVAACVSRAVRGAIRQAYSTKCMSNMKNLHNAVMAYVADKNGYPYATSWEFCEKKVYESGGEAKKKFYLRKGWVSWVRNGDSDLNKNPWKDPANGPYASKFHYPASTDPDMVAGITNGCLFKYVGKDVSAYVCPSHIKNNGGKTIYLSYAMNSFFRWGRDWESVFNRNLLVSDSGPERWWHKDTSLRNEHPYDHFNVSKGYWKEDEREVGVDSSRMALFVEIDEDGPCPKSSNTKRKGIDGDAYNWAYYEVNGKPSWGIRIPDFYPDDCVWDWTDEYRDWPSDCHEIGRGWYDKAKKKSHANHFKGGHYSHVIYLDGHVGAVRGGELDPTVNTFDDLHNPRRVKDD